MSNEQIKYLKNIKKEKRVILLIQIFIIILFFVLWQVLADKGIINTFIVSKPSKIFFTFINLYKTNNIFIHIFTTLKELFIAFFLGIIFGFIIAVFLYEFPFIAKIIDPFLTMLNSLPKVALGPLIIIIGGANIKSVIIMALLINLIISIITIYNGFLNTDKTKIKLLNSFKANKKQMLLYLIIPNSYNTIISSLKINISMSLIGLLPPVGEKIFFNKCYSRY